MDNLKEVITSLKVELGKIILVAVSKTKSNEEILNVYNLGIRDFGENYVQELTSKMDLLPKDIKWHMIGHLQTNKVKDIIKRNIFMIESVDSIKLANVINKEAIKNQKVINILIEVNIANDQNKTGCKLEDLDNLVIECKKLSNIKLLGLMAIGPNSNDTYLVKESFKKMNELKKKYHLELLSIGMSSDYKLAIEVGADIVRIGTKIFGKRNYGGKV